MVVECTPGRLVDIVSVSVESEVCGRFGLANVLGVRASQCAVSEIDCIRAFTV